MTTAPTILVVVDDPAVLRSVGRMLDDSYTVLLASSGAEASHLARTNAVDLALTDIMMPVRNQVRPPFVEVEMRTPRKMLAVVLAPVSLAYILKATEPWEGTWKLNVEKSPASATMMQSQVVKLAAEGDMILMTEDNVTANGLKYRVTAKLALDGKDYPVMGSIAGIALISGKRLSPTIAEMKAKKKDGSVWGTIWFTQSADGNMRISLRWVGDSIVGPPAGIAFYDRR